MHTYFYPRYTLTEKMLLGSAKFLSKSVEWAVMKCFEKIKTFEEAFFDWETDGSIIHHQVFKEHYDIFNSPPRHPAETSTNGPLP
jgi:hypothetical protein